MTPLPEQSYRTIPLTQGYEAIVNESDYPQVSQFSWHAEINKRGLKTDVYAARWIVGLNGKRRRMRMHVELMGYKQGMEVDHRDRNGLNNCRSNLRFATHADNSRNASIRQDNTSGFKGVTFEPYTRGSKKWKSTIQYDKRRITIGRYLTAKDAAMAYNDKAMRLFGEFACLNVVS